MKQAVLWSVLLSILLTQEALARRESFTPEEKNKLEKIDRVLVEVIALSDKGTLDSKDLTNVVVKRMKELGYTTMTDPTQPSDAAFQVKCEQTKTWEGTTRMGSDADLPDSPSRLWKGPACQLSYSLGGKKMGWRKEVRTDFPDAEQAAAAAKAGDAGTYAMVKLRERLEDYDFPALITAEWGQDERLFKLYDDPATPSARKVRLIGLFGYIFSTEAVPRLLAGLKGNDIEIAKASALALGNIGQKDTVPALIQTMKSGPPELRPSAAKALGILGALHGDFTIVDPLLETLKTTDDVALKTEVVWALGKLPDRRAQEPLFALQKSLYHVRENDADPNLVKLKEAVNWSTKQIDTWEYLQ
ncbi:MAG: HEAT repeat domain-containing protein [Nitrospira sp. CR1.3]|nr:HEAT repeat domain-containing protein [Nitrospira sp. CR1.3]